MYPLEAFSPLSSDEIANACFKSQEEWWKECESLGNDRRLGWVCGKHREEYFVRLLEFEFEEECGSGEGGSGKGSGGSGGSGNEVWSSARGESYFS
jgi:hypothetical protein